jgi:hypothetical protein
MGRHVAHMGKRSGVYRVLVGKLEGNIPFGRPRQRWKDKIKWQIYICIIKNNQIQFSFLIYFNNLSSICLE